MVHREHLSREYKYTQSTTALCLNKSVHKMPVYTKVTLCINNEESNTRRRILTNLNFPALTLLINVIPKYYFSVLMF